MVQNASVVRRIASSIKWKFSESVRKVVPRVFAVRVNMDSIDGAEAHGFLVYGSAERDKRI